jgi:hypothetical protein
MWTNLIMFLDRLPDEQRIALAARLGIAVVVELTPGDFSLVNAVNWPVLTGIFAPSAIG